LDFKKEEESYFDTLVGFEHITNPKPHAEPILKALSNLNIEDKNRVFMIGDTPMDIISSINAGVNPIAVTSGYTSYEALKKYTSQIHNNVFEAVKYIKSR
jgi:phosphoglycolate phosphatase